MTTVAIMQPTYMPWAGYLALMDRVDVFVFLDSVQFERRSWQQRNRIKTASGELMLTVPVHKKGRREQTIAEVTINHEGDPLGKHARSIASAYAKAPYMASLGQELIAILARKPERLVDLNLAIIEWARRILAIDTPCPHSSAMAATGRKADLLAAICRELGASRYISPPGSRVYLDQSTALAQINVEVDYFNYECPRYGQLHGDFLPFFSVVDLILNHGPDSGDIMRAGIKQVAA
jgi:WbqC-like protein family